MLLQFLSMILSVDILKIIHCFFINWLLITQQSTIVIFNSHIELDIRLWFTNLWKDFVLISPASSHTARLFNLQFCSIWRRIFSLYAWRKSILSFLSEEKWPSSTLSSKKSISASIAYRSRASFFPSIFPLFNFNTKLRNIL